MTNKPDTPEEDLEERRKTIEPEQGASYRRRLPESTDAVAAPTERMTSERTSASTSKSGDAIGDIPAKDKANLALQSLKARRYSAKLLEEIEVMLDFAKVRSLILPEALQDDIDKLFQIQDREPQETPK